MLNGFIDFNFTVHSLTKRQFVREKNANNYRQYSMWSKALSYPKHSN